MHLYGENVEKSFSELWLKLTMYNESCKTFKLQSNNCPGGLSVLSLGLYKNIKVCNLLKSSSLKQFDQFLLDFTWGLLSKGY